MRTYQHITGWRLKLLRCLLGDLIKQGPQHFAKTTECYLLVREAWENAFFEQNAAAHDMDTLTCFNRTMQLGEAKYRPF